MGDQYRQVALILERWPLRIGLTIAVQYMIPVRNSRGENSPTIAHWTFQPS